ncbi:G8 domain-containing protein [Fulvivirgaceae bacterium BMA10]|uniref:G8 domain-containing protein n=1 Tax=Splendidivirga corallicola TaxID=3051826 RepID=A0ABT8KQV9_9BACT|nr:G8 domain-containing protein [Fulvivirgaceae bacterium BMA10]
MRNLILILLICFGCELDCFGQVVWGSEAASANPMKPLGTNYTPDFTAISGTGNWSDAGTWGGATPTDNSRVEIPSGATVIVDGEIPEAIKSIVLKGTLKFANSINTKLRVEYLHSMASGTLEIGTPTAPIADGVTAEITFPDLGGSTTDFWGYVPGMVLMGPVTMHGQAKTTWTTLGTNAVKGTNTLTLGTEPTGWKVGDKLVVAATTPQNMTSDDVATIESISGTSVTLTSPLTYDHQPPTQAPDLKVHVANYTRNIKISSENTSVSAKRRGHIMYMHNLNVVMKFVECENLGRTDKRVRVNDFTGWGLDLYEGQTRAPNFSPPLGSNTNPRGRYSVHFHRGGVNPALTPAHVEGVTVFDDPGWGFVNHSSRVDFVKNATYGVVGGAFNTEAGDETGSFVENIALRTVNPDDPFQDVRLPEATVDDREGGMDFAFQGDAFWFHSWGVTIEGNVAAGTSGHSYVFWPEGLFELGLGRREGTPAYHISDPAMRALVEGTTSKESGLPWTFDCWMIPAKPFKNNTAYTANKGISSYYSHTRFLAIDDEEVGVNNKVPQAYRDMLDINIDRSIIWNIRITGMEFFYNSHVTVTNSEVYGYGSPSTSRGIDADHFHNLDNWLFNNITIKGFNNSNVALSVPMNANSVIVENSTFDNTHTDIKIRESNFRYGLEPDEQDRVIGQIQRNLMLKNLTFTNPDRNIVMAANFDMNHELQDGVTFTGDAKNLYYFLIKENITLDYGPFDNMKLYFDEQAPDFIPINDTNYFRLDDDEGTPDPEWQVPGAFRNKTNLELRALGQTNGASFGGEILPSTAVDHPTIVGGKVGADMILHINTHEASPLFSIYPNPTIESFKINTSLRAYTVRILSLTGQSMDIDLTDDRIITHHLPAGIYLVQIIDEESNQIFTTKLVKN